MSGKKQFVALFDAMAERLLEQIDERNEEFLEQFRSIQEDGMLLESGQTKDDDSKQVLEPVPVVAPRIGISETARNLFGEIPDERRRIEFMWRFSQMEYAKAAGDWMQWGAYLIMLLEGLSNDCLGLFIAERVGLEDGVHQLELIETLFDEKTRGGGELGEGDYRRYGWGIDERRGSLVSKEGADYYRVLSVDFIEDKVELNTMDEYGLQQQLIIKLDGLSPELFSLDVIGVFLDKSVRGKDGLNVTREQVEFLIGPLPHGEALPKKENKRQIKIIKTPGGGRFSIFESINGGFPQHRWPSIYFASNHVDKIGNEHWNLYRSKQPNARDFTQLRLVDRILLTEFLANSWSEGGRVLSRNWQEFRSDPSNNVIEEIINIRNAYCHGNAYSLRLNPKKFIHLFENRMQHVIGLSSKFLRSTVVREVRGFGVRRVR